MARDEFNDTDGNEDDAGFTGGHQPPADFLALLGRLFGAGAAPATDPKVEDEFYQKAKPTALRVAAAILPPKSRSGTLFAELMSATLFAQLEDSPFVVEGWKKKLNELLEKPTGVKREQVGVAPRDEVFADVLHDKWFEHVLHHGALFLWHRLGGDPAKKEAALEEMLPVVEKYGKAIIALGHTFAGPAKDGNSLQVAADCAIREIRPLFFREVRLAGMFDLDGAKGGDPGQ